MSINNWISNFFLDKEQIAEKQTLEQWKSEAQSNLDGMKKMLEHENALHQIKGYQAVDKNKAWDHIEQQLDFGKSTTTRSIFLKVAAAFLLLLGAWFIINVNNNSTFNPKEYSTNTAHQTIKLSDLSMVQLDNNSKLSELDFRQVKLEGRAYFDITKDAKHPFTIDLYHGDITVLGTAFDIFTSIAYTQIYVTEGTVKFSFKSKDYILKVGDLATINSDGIVRHKSENIQVKAWQNQKLVFTNESMTNVLNSIATYHHKQLILDTSVSKDGCKINTSYTTETLTQILQELSTIAGLKYQIENDKIIIKSFKC